MIVGERTILRARTEADVPVLHAELYDDVVGRSRADGRPWQPVPVGPGSPFAPAEPSDDTAAFSIVERRGGDLAGVASLWSIDVHNRMAHLGISLRPSYRGKGLGADAIGVLCRYGFSVRGLHRLQIETLSDNQAMLQTARRTGFTEEGILRASAWVDGAFADEVVLGLLAGEWSAS